MALFFAAQGSSEDIWRERNQGILRRLCSTPHSPAVFLLAKCAASAVVLAAISTFGLLVGMLYHGLPLVRLPLAVAWSTLTGTLLLAMMLALQLSARSQRAGSILTNSILFPLLMLGGSFIPMDVMPSWMGTLGRYTPNGWSVGVLSDVLLGRAEPSRFLIGVALFAATGALLFLFSAKRMRGTFASGN
jgi:ABC-type multidrug transport system permease subunit